MYIDTHAHIYDEKFTADFDTQIQLCLQNGVNKILMPNCDSTTIQAMYACQQKYEDICISMMGVHPCYVKDNYKDELAIVENELAKRKFCAIGEIGLDFYWDKTHIQQQEYALVHQIELALHYKLPIVIHSRESTQGCIDIIKPYIAKGLQGVFHCYSGTLVQAELLTKEMDFYIGIGGVVTYKKSGLDAIVAAIDLNKMVLETDAPYLAPTPHRGKRNECAFIPIIADCIATIKQMPLAEVAQTTTANANQLFGL